MASKKLQMNFKEVLDKDKIFEIVKQCASDLGIEAYVVGGFVRDLILKRPSKDVDFVCVGSGIALAKKVASTLNANKSVQVFKNFGTASITHKDFNYEFVGARKESYQRDSRKPIVEDGTLEDDQNRRDFTINALAISLNGSSYGELIDPFEGVKDLKRKIIRTPLAPDVTFSDDPLRMMRAVRFASQLGFDIQADTFDSIIKNAGRLKIISQERITDELNKIILSETPSYGFKLLYHAQLLDKFFPELTNLQGVEEKNGHKHKDNFYHTLQVLDNTASLGGDLWLRWAAILHDIAKPATKRFHAKQGWTFHGHEDKGSRMVPKIFQRLKLPLNDRMKYVQKLVLLHLRPIPLVRDNITDNAVRRLLFEAGDDIEDLLNLCRADVTSKNPARVQKYLSNFDLVEQKMKEVEEKDQVRNFQPPISGEDIMQTFNLQPGREIGIIKNEIKEAILDGKIKNNREEAYEFMLEAGKKLNLTITS
ncbi:tRNA nucleotidyltransferase [Marivirga lumbricoides]|uniref:tRNA nucleotidyltransferase n=2 Tax=Marivirga lumbricoides TaxID=1046115 RepID=A0ABQ1M0X0_9BACT|nr:tRNA nucleotidyltransferase [Marivirga lumbricoides]